MPDDVLDRLSRANPVPDDLDALPIEPLLNRLEESSSNSPARRLRATLPVALGIGVALLVTVVALLTISRRAASPSTTGRSSPSPTTVATPASPVPTLDQLLANFAVLRRPQTTADRSWQPHLPVNDGEMPKLTRLARTLSGGVHIFLSVERFQDAPGGSPPAGSYSLDIDIVSSGRDSGTDFGPNVNYTVFPLSSPTGTTQGLAPATTWASVIPDGVAQVRWTFACPPRARCHDRPVTVTLPVRENVAAASVPGTSDGCPPPQNGCRQPDRITWYGTDGRVVASYSRAAKRNLAAPPFIKTRPLPAALARSFHVFRGLVADQARFVANIDGSQLSVMPGSVEVCLLQRPLRAVTRKRVAVRAGGDCVPDSKALAGEMSPITGGPSGVTVTGLAPDGNRTVRLVLADGSSETVPVFHNIYVAHALHGFKTVTLKDSRGAVRTYHIPDGG